MHTSMATEPRKESAIKKQTHKHWLKLTALVIGSFGPIFFLGTMAKTAEPARLTLDLLSWPIDGATTFSHPDTRFLSALTGGFLTGWGVMVWCLSAWVYDLAPRGVRRSVLAGLCAWFALDSTGSIASGNASNALINILVLALAAGPLWVPASDEIPSQPSEELQP
jgi:biotin transporter BioY